MLRHTSCVAMAIESRWNRACCCCCFGIKNAWNGERCQWPSSCLCDYSYFNLLVLVSLSLWSIPHVSGILQCTVFSSLLLLAIPYKCRSRHVPLDSMHRLDVNATEISLAVVCINKTTLMAIYTCRQ